MMVVDVFFLRCAPRAHADRLCNTSNSFVHQGNLIDIFIFSYRSSNQYQCSFLRARRHRIEQHELFFMLRISIFMPVDLTM